MIILLQYVKKNPKRFVGLATLPMQSSELAVQELERCMKIGFAGIQIGSHINDMTLADPKLFPVFQACERLGAAVFIHPWDMCGEDLMKKYWLPWLVGMPMETSLAICSLIFGGIFERLPKLRVGFAHGGGSFVGTIGRIEHGFKVRPDLVAIDNKVNPRNYCGRFWVDSLVHDKEALTNCIKLFGPERIVLGSDYPFPLGEDKPGELVESMSDLTEQEKDDICWKNALEFLGMSTKQFIDENDEDRKEIIRQKSKDKQFEISASMQTVQKELPVQKSLEQALSTLNIVNSLSHTNSSSSGVQSTSTSL